MKGEKSEVERIRAAVKMLTDVCHEEDEEMENISKTMEKMLMDSDDDEEMEKTME